jgi:hypothetical protein
MREAADLIIGLHYTLVVDCPQNLEIQTSG